MQLDLCLAETERLAREQASMLEEARHKLQTQQGLTALEQSGIPHALQILIENAIGKANTSSRPTGSL
jgi:hypothetical protein